MSKNLNINGLIYKALQENNSRVLTVIPYHLWRDTERKYIDFIISFLTKYNELPKFSILDDEFVDFRIEPEDFADLPLKYVFDNVVEQLQQQYVKNEMVDRQKESQLNPSISLYDKDFLIELAQSVKIADLTAITYSDFDRTEHFNENSKMLSWGIPFLDNELLGLTGGDLIYFFGRMKSNKTTFLLISQLQMMRNGVKVLVCSNEMTNRQLVQKNDAMLVGFNPKLFRTQKWTTELKEKLKKVKEIIKRTGGDIHFAGAVNTPADVLSEYMNAPFVPDVIMIDGANKMGKIASDSAGQSLSQKAVSNGLTRIAIEKDIPIVAVTHAKRGSGKSEELGADDVSWSDELAKDCTGLVGFAQVEQNDEIYVKINVAANRFGEFGNTQYAKIDWDTMKVTFHENEMSTPTFQIANIDAVIKNVIDSNKLDELQLFFNSKSEEQIDEYFSKYINKDHNIILVQLVSTLFLVYVSDGKLQDITILQGDRQVGEINYDDVIELEQDDRLELYGIKFDVFNIESN